MTLLDQLSSSRRWNATKRLRRLVCQPFGSMVLVFLSLILEKASIAEVPFDAWTAEHFRLASEAQRQNDLNRAAKEYQLILSRNPKIAEVYQNLGILFHQQRKYREAAKTLQSAVSLKPDLLSAQLFLGIDKYLIQDFKGAIGPLQHVLRLQPNERQAGLYLAFAYLGLDLPEKAARQLRNTAKFFAGDSEIIYHLGEAYLEGVRQRMALLQQAGEESAERHWALALSAEQKGDMSHNSQRIPEGVGSSAEHWRALFESRHIPPQGWSF